MSEANVYDAGSSLIPKQELAAVPVVAMPFDSAVDWMLDAVKSDRPASHMHFVNAYTLALASRQPELLNVLRDDSAVSFPDGKPLGWVSRARRDRPRVTQVRGPSTFKAVLDAGREREVKHYFLGGTEHTLGLLIDEVTRSYPGVHIAGFESPPFREPSEAELRERDERILASGADLVWVGLGTPKQDFEAKRIVDAIGVPTAAVGAAFDFVAGTVREAPAIFGKLGIEWLYRLIAEPKRLWRRYLFGNARFLRLAARDIARSRRRTPSVSVFSDWSANRGRPHIQVALLLFRLASRAKHSRWLIGRVAGIPIAFAYRAFALAVVGLDLPRSAIVGERLVVHHGIGLVVHDMARIGQDVTLRHGVTIGAKAGSREAPTIGDRVAVGSGAQIIGAISIGDDAQIGAAAVVTKDVPRGATVVGNPARIHVPKTAES